MLIEQQDGSMRDITLQNNVVLKCKLEVLSHILANGENNQFARNASKTALIFQPSWWYSAFTKAIEASNSRSFHPSMICPYLEVVAPTDIFIRKYGDNSFRRHECILPGTVINVTIELAPAMPVNDFIALLTYVGKFVGMSPYGHRLGFGKFKVVSVEKQKEG